MLIADLDDRSPQGSFPDERWRERPGNAPRRPDAVFFALYPDQDTARRLGRLAWYLRDKHRLKGRPLLARCFHISLQRVGDHTQITQDAVALIGDAVSTITMRPFAVAFDRAMSFIGPANRPLVLLGDDGVAGLTMLQRELVAALRKIGFARRNQPQYNPHLTLLYDNCPVPDQAVEEIGWTVRELVLVRSLYGRSRHLPLARWPLRG